MATVKQKSKVSKDAKLTKVVNVRLDRGMLNRIDAQAKKSQRTRSNQIYVALGAWLEMAEMQ